VRIALVHYTVAPVVAGVELVMAAHARLFRAVGHEVTLIAEADRGASAEILIEKLRPALAAQHVVFLHNVATMHFHLALTAALGRLAAELPEVRFVCWIHDLGACNPDYAPLPPAARELLTQAHPRYEYVAVSELRRTQFLGLTNQPTQCCRAIPNGVNPAELLDLPPRIAALAEQHGLFEREIVLLQPARLLRRKNVEFTLRVTAALHAAGHSTAALITAPPEVHLASSYAAEVRALRDELDLNRDAFFLDDEGPLTERELQGCFRLADALFFPSRQEGFGIPLLEAAVHRLPIFCSDIEPLRSLLPHGVVTFSLDDAPKKVAALVVRTLDADRARAARRATVRHFSWDAIYRNYLFPLLLETKTT
jgi:glycosyltransferase involved in cell wall biosynthesis